jgi:hypothetical protein
MTTHNYVIIYSNGHAENVSENVSWYGVLEKVGMHMSSARNSTPLAKMLLRDGEIIVDKDLAQIGYDYITNKRRAVDASINTVRRAYAEPDPISIIPVTPFKYDGDEGQRFVMKYSDSPDTMHVDSILGYAHTLEAAEDIANAWRKLPTKPFVWVVDREAPATNAGDES